SLCGGMLIRSGPEATGPKDSRQIGVGRARSFRPFFQRCSRRSFLSLDGHSSSLLRRPLRVLFLHPNRSKGHRRRRAPSPLRPCTVPPRASKSRPPSLGTTPASFAGFGAQLSTVDESHAFPPLSTMAEVGVSKGQLTSGLSNPNTLLEKVLFPTCTASGVIG